MSSPNQQSSSVNHPQQKEKGVLFKRRDVFRNKWRPRMFHLDGEVLTYYLLSKSGEAPRTISTPLRRSSLNNSSSHGQSAANLTPNHSVHSTVSYLAAENANENENLVDYDVVPRGAMYLAGCSVSVNDSLSLPQEGLFAFSIIPPNSDATAYHLAAKTEESRASWIKSLSGASTSGDNGDNAVAQNGDDEVASSAASWKSQSPLEKLFDNVSAPLAANLEQSLETYLELCDDISPALRWTPIFQDRDGVSAFQRQDLHGRIMMKSTATIPHHPKQLLNLLLDCGRRSEYETNIAVTERVDVLNPFTFLDYYAFKAVWPTSPRDFAVVLHWQTLHRRLADRNKEEAIVVLAFSCLEAEILKEPTAQNVRASLHASFYLLRLIPPTAGDEQPASKCHVTRILSYDLGGALPRNLATTVLMQQAAMPGILSKYLKRVEPSPETRLSTNEDRPITNEGMIKDVVQNIIEHDKSEMVSSARRRLNFDKSSQDDAESESCHPEQQAETPKPLSVPMTAVALMVPLLVRHLTETTSMLTFLNVFDLWFLRPTVIFLLSAFIAVRFVVVFSLGEELPNTQALRSFVGGPITCSMHVDLKGALRFIGMKKEEKKELASSKKSNSALSTPAEISVVHIVTSALARALVNHSECWNYRRVSLKFLGVDGFFRYPSTKLDISLSLHTERLVCLHDFACKSVQAVADGLQSAEQEQPQALSTLDGVLSSLVSIVESRYRHCRCLIILTTDNKDSSQANDSGGVEITLANIPSDIDVLLTVGELRLQRMNSSVGSPLRTSPPKPFLSLSLTVNTASVLDTSKCHAFAEDLAKLIQFPELCDD